MYFGVNKDTVCWSFVVLSSLVLASSCRFYVREGFSDHVTYPNFVQSLNQRVLFNISYTNLSAHTLMRFA